MCISSPYVKIALPVWQDRRESIFGFFGEI
jgi:hypothetical protein